MRRTSASGWNGIGRGTRGFHRVASAHREHSLPALPGRRCPVQALETLIGVSVDTATPLPAAPARPASLTLAEALRFWLKLGFVSFGGPAGQIALMHEELVDRRRWISEKRFLHALNYCMLLPGPEAQQLATYIGWLLHRTWGGIAAGASPCAMYSQARATRMNSDGSTNSTPARMPPHARCSSQPR